VDWLEEQENLFKEGLSIAAERDMFTADKGSLLDKIWNMKLCADCNDGEVVNNGNLCNKCYKRRIELLAQTDDDAPLGNLFVLGQGEEVDAEVERLSKKFNVIRIRAEEFDSRTSDGDLICRLWRDEDGDLRSVTFARNERLEP